MALNKEWSLFVVFVWRSSARSEENEPSGADKAALIRAVPQ